MFIFLQHIFFCFWWKNLFFKLFLPINRIPFFFPHWSPDLFFVFSLQKFDSLCLCVNFFGFFLVTEKRGGLNQPSRIHLILTLLWHHPREYVRTSCQSSKSSSAPLGLFLTGVQLVSEYFLCYLNVVKFYSVKFFFFFHRLPVFLSFLLEGAGLLFIYFCWNRVCIDPRDL